MGLLVCLLILCGGTVQLKDGEIFEGKIIGETADRVWLQVPSGGVISFDKDKVAYVTGRNPAFIFEPEPQEEESSRDCDPQTRKFTPGGGKARARQRRLEVPRQPLRVPGDKEVVVWWRPMGGEVVREILLICPDGFKFKRGRPGETDFGVLTDDAGGAQVAFQAKEYSDTIDRAASELEVELGRNLFAHRAFRWEGREVRIMEWESSGVEKDLAGLTCITLDQGTLLRMVATVKKSLAPAYRPVFLRIFRNVTFRKTRGGPQDGNASGAGSKKAEKEVQPRVAADPPASQALKNEAPAAKH